MRSRSDIRFLLNGKPVSVHDVSPNTTLLDYLRNQQQLKGTKEGCAEGDCGACTVVLAEYAGANHASVRFYTANACIQLLPAVDGKAVFTVEALKQRGATGDTLHPVQQAMVEHHGSQCGFCTPGFIMSLWDLYLRHEDGSRPSRASIKSQLTGNLCRCTGYRPILDAGQAMFDLPRVHMDKTTLGKDLATLHTSPTLRYSHNGMVFDAPQSLEALLELRTTYPQATILAGGTDVGLWVTKRLRSLDHVIYLGRVDSLSTIKQDGNNLCIGAGADLNQAHAAIAQWYPQIRSQRERFASMPIRNTGTMGGNVANGSPIGDCMPWLIALGAQVTLASQQGERSMALEELYLDYMKKAMRQDEIVLELRIPAKPRGQVFRTYKLSKRFDSDISAVCAAFAIQLDGASISSARVAFGGMAATPCRAAAAEQALVGNKWSESTARQAMAALAQDYQPMSDMRASSGYRMRAAQNLLYRLYLETRPDAPLAQHKLDVFDETAIGVSD